MSRSDPHHGGRFSDIPRWQSAGRPREGSTVKGEILVEARGLSWSFGPKRVLGDISFTLRSGEVTGFLGANGAGKTTAIQLMLGLLKGEGRTTYLGRPLYEWGAPGTVVGAVLGYQRDRERSGSARSRPCSRTCSQGDAGYACT
ncbi:ATP-binding cassette domain-containing protein [Streptomyces sp. WG5]|uniref:ATP-binding cassette domain-containing protein n=1 Tax=Streptomyces sp. WG5 TaxID=3417648 RepID=UPI003CEEE491